MSCIANNVGNRINKIELKNVYVSGINTISGLVGYTEEQEITNITADNVNIEATGNYVGGIIGNAVFIDYMDSIKIDNIQVQNSYIQGVNRVGGIAGYARVNNSKSIHNQIHGYSSIGGISGETFQMYNNIVDDAKITATGPRVGGIAGSYNSLYRSTVKNSKIEGETTESNYIGGIGGTGARTERNSVINTNIISKGSNIGGINGGTTGVEYGYVENCNIEGNSNVGGITGNLGLYRGIIQACYVNAVITATSHSAGGITGYIQNKLATDNVNAITIYNNAVYGVSVQSDTKVGGLIGEAEVILYEEEQFKSNYIEAYLNSKNSMTVSLGVGSNASYNEKLKDNYIYQYSTINGENINLLNECYIPISQYLKEEELKEKSTYIDKIKLTSLWNYSKLQEAKYPILNVAFMEEQEGIEIPKDSEHIVNEEAGINTLSLEDDNLEEPQETFEYNGKKIETYDTYSVITNTDGEVVRREERLYVKDGKLYVIDGSLNMVTNNLIVDSYNGKEYETILGSDGKLYDLKDKLHYPENFVNENIKTIGNNLHQEEKEITVTYEDGSKVIFNYQTGEVIEEQKLENNTSLLDYLKEQLETGNNLIENTTESYEENKILMSKLQTTPIEKAMELKNNEDINNIVEEQTENTIGSSNEISSITSNNRGSYITVYNSSKKEFEVYKEEEILDVDTKEVVSQNEKIEKNNLNEYYVQEARTEKETSGIVWVLLSITGVVIVLFVLWKRR